MEITNWILLVVTDVLILVFFAASINEKEKRAAGLGLIALVCNSCLWGFFIFFKQLQWVPMVNLAVFVLGILVLSVSLVRYFPSREERDLSAVEKCDERDVMFSRNRLKYHPELAERYYAVHPEKRDIDVKIHGKPELGEPGGLYYDAYRSPVFDAAFSYLHRTRGASVGGGFPEKKKVDGEVITRVIGEMARHYGAVDVGVTRIKPYHVYSHYGRHVEDWGKEVETSHTYAVVIVVAMSVGMIKAAPSLPVILESARHYVESAKIAHIVAEYIRGFGYDARSHTDGNYEVMCVPLAVDAGLGVLGRIGIFMHPVHGPCVRLSVVTTELELVPTLPKVGMVSIERFCDICKKCADNCPTQSICVGEELVGRGFRHWFIDQERCFSFWKNIGTDCGFCIGVCPYTKPDTFIHRLVRFYISRNPLNQRVALFLDDLFYGRKKPIPKGKV